MEIFSNWIETPLLQIFALFYLFLGSQLVQTQWHKWISVLIFGWNLCFNLTVVYGLYAMDPLKMDLVVTKCVTKPLFTYFAHISTKYTFPGVYFLYCVYQHYYGHRILHALDFISFRRFYQCKRQAKFIFIFFTLINHFFVLSILLERHQVHRLKQWPSMHDWLGYISLYVVFQYVFWICIILHYYQYATYRLLVQIHSKLTLNRSSKCIIEALVEIKNLAKANQLLNHLLSPAFIMYLVFIVFNLTRIACFSLVCEPNIRLLLQLAITCVYLCYIVWLNSNVCQTLNQICASLKSYNKNELQITSYNEWNSVYNCSPTQSRKISLQEINVYCKYFPIKVFLLVTIDFRFLLQTALFILTYVVFFTQTN